MYKLESFGSFFVGGRKIKVNNQPSYKVKRSEASPEITIDPNGEFIVESTYVQYFIPEENNLPPILFVHGGGNTGAVWENTPDGRTGWLHYFLSQNHPCYVVDSVERGRAGFCNHPDVWPGIPERKSLKTIWKSCRIGLEENYGKQIPYKGSQFPIECLDALSQLDVPRWNCNQPPSSKALIDLSKKIGKTTLISHSQSSEFVLQAAMSAKNLDTLIFIEPASFPPHIDFSQFKGKRVLFVYGDHFDGNSFWEPLLIQAKEFAEKLRDFCKVDWYDLPSMGHPGNTHFLMMDKNHLKIAEKIYSWLKSIQLN